MGGGGGEEKKKELKEMNTFHFISLHYQHFLFRVCELKHLKDMLVKRSFDSVIDRVAESNGDLMN